MTYDYHRQDELRRTRIEKGLCTHCGKPPAPGKRACEWHLLKAREAQRRATARKRERRMAKEQKHA